ncbi:hypothetical protein HPP92_025547 [Vanilla planifolia]|uniref:Uncharacterized protein n=1 Tax=Vanilla planifolia TaxID=51239 RepID=A0A835PK78_VANPL|nr:hypothetical protein HPP92_025547 [Vanilla planifolia]
MAAAEQLIQLSESSVESAEEALTIAPITISSALSSSSSPLSVGSTSVPPRNRMPPFAVADDDEDEDLRRLRARYRKLEEVYAEGASAVFGGRMWRRRKKGDLEWSRECC